MLSPISASTREKISRSSVATTALTGVPSTAQPRRARSPERSSERPTLSAVWPPIEMRIPSGRSFLMISSTKRGVTGRK